jgi:hypothetical protein
VATGTVAGMFASDSARFHILHSPHIGESVCSEHYVAYVRHWGGGICPLPLEQQFRFGSLVTSSIDQRYLAEDFALRKSMLDDGYVVANLQTRECLFWLLHDIYHAFDPRLTVLGVEPDVDPRYVTEGVCQSDAFKLVEHETLRWGLSRMPEARRFVTVKSALAETRDCLDPEAVTPEGRQLKPAIKVRFNRAGYNQLS